MDSSGFGIPTSLSLSIAISKASDSFTSDNIGLLFSLSSTFGETGRVITTGTSNSLASIFNSFKITSCLAL